MTRTAVHEMRGLTTSDYELTHHEELMRTYAESLAQNGRDESVTGKLSGFAEKVGFAESNHELERSIKHDSGVTAFERRKRARRPGALVAAIDNDHRLTVALAKASERVYRDDWKRLQFLSTSPDVNSSTSINVIGRARENRRILLRTHQMLINRVDDYRLEARDSILRYPHAKPDRLYLEIDRLAVLVDELRLSIRPLATPGRPPGSVITPSIRPRGTDGPRPLLGDGFKSAKAS